MKEYIKEYQERQAHKAKPLPMRFYLFWTTKKRRIFYLVMLYCLYHYSTRLRNFFSSRYHRTVNKYKKRWINRYNPEAILFSTPDDFNYVPQKISKENTDKLTATFLRGENMLKNGFSR